MSRLYIVITYAYRIIFHIVIYARYNIHRGSVDIVVIVNYGRTLQHITTIEQDDVGINSAYGIDKSENLCHTIVRFCAADVVVRKQCTVDIGSEENFYGLCTG